MSDPAEPQSSEQLPPWWSALRTALLLILPALVFSNSLEGQYHLDDVYRIRDNPEIERVFPMSRHFLDPRTSATLPNLAAYRPLLPLSLSLNAAAGDALGLDRLVSLHLGNLAIHLIVCLLLNALFRELLRYWSGRDRSAREVEGIAFWATLIFAIHPVSGVPVNYLCGRDLSLMLLFLVAAALQYVRWRRTGEVWRVAAALALATLALLGKTNAIVACGLVFAFEQTCGKLKLTDGRLWSRTVVSALPAFAFLAFTKWVLDFSDADQVVVDGQGRWIYALTELDVHLTYYLRNAIWPFAMRARPLIEPAESLFQPAVAAGAILVVTSFVLAWSRRGVAPLFSLGVLAYWIFFSLTSSVIPMRSAATDYRQYPPLVGLVLLVTLAVYGLRSEKLRTGLLVVLVGWLSFGAFTMNRVWRTEVSFWKQAVDHGATALGHMNYGVAVRGQDPDLARVHFERALELEPNHVFAHINLGLLHIFQGREDEGRALLVKATRLTPEWAITHHWHSIGLGNLGELDAAAEASWRAHELDPRVELYRNRAAEAHYLAAHAAQVEGRVADSRSLLEKVHQLVSHHADSLFLEGFALQQAGELEDSIARYDRHLALDAGHVQSMFNKAYAQLHLERHAEALEGFRAVLAAKPSYTEAHLHASTCLRALGREDEALAERALYDAARAGG